MRPADTWKDYELLDATEGNRLERWGETILIRPDPQVVWKTPKQFIVFPGICRAHSVLLSVCRFSPLLFRQSLPPGGGRRHRRCRMRALFTVPKCAY